MGHRSTFSLTFFRYTDYNVLKNNYITVTVHILLIQYTLMKQFLLVIMLHWLFSCVLFMSSAAFIFCLYLLSSCRASHRPRDTLCNTRKITPKPNQLPPFKLAFLAIIHSCLGILQDSKDMAVCPSLVENPQASFLLSVVRAQIAFSFLLYAVLKIFGRRPEMQKTEL